MIDTHCHLTHPRLAGEADAVVQRARQAGLSGCISIGTGVADGRAVLDLVRRHKGFVHGTVGIDPFTSHRLADRFDEEARALEEMLAAGGFVALGEVGLDYHYDLDPRPEQARRLLRQMEIAERLDLPVVLHVRDAHDDLAALLAKGPRCRGVVHSFTAGPREAERYLELGWHLAFNGVATFRNAPEVREAAVLTPDDRILLETDSPYLAPMPLRGRRCEPAYVTHTCEALAGARAVDAGALAHSTTGNARALFRLGDGGPRR